MNQQEIELIFNHSFVKEGAVGVDESKS